MNGTAAVAGHPTPRLAWWGIALLLDLVLLAFLPYVGWIALLVGGTLAAAWIVREPSRALAFAALGQPFIAAIGYRAGIDPALVLTDQLVVVVPLGLRLWQQVWDWPQPNRGWRGPEMPIAARWLLVWTLLLALALGIGLLFTPSPSYGRSKFIFFVIRNGLFLFGAWKLLQPDSTFGSAEQKGVAFLRLLLGLGVALALLALWNLGSGYWPTGSRLSVADLNPIWFARYLGVGILAVASLVAMRRLSAPAAVIALIVLVPAFYLAGSRGPLLAILTAGCFFLLSGRSWNTPTRRFILVAVPLLALVWVGFTIAEGVFEDGSPFGSRSASNVARKMMLEVALDWISRPGWFGLGTGAYSSLVGVGDMRFYPHNIFIEVWLENGALGLLALVGFLLATLRLWKGTRREGVLRGSLDRERVRFAATWFVYSLVNAQFSGDLPGNEHLFLAAGALAAWSHSSAGGPRSRSPQPRPTRAV